MKIITFNPTAISLPSVKTTPRVPNILDKLNPMPTNTEENRFKPLHT